MKPSQVIVALSASRAFGYGVSPVDTTTIICSGCPTDTLSTPDIVTRSDIPTIPCSTPEFTIISSAEYSGDITSYPGTGAVPTTKVASYAGSEAIPTTLVTYPGTAATPATTVTPYKGTTAAPTTKGTTYPTSAVPTTKPPVVVSGGDRIIASLSSALALAFAVAYLA